VRYFEDIKENNHIKYNEKDLEDIVNKNDYKRLKYLNEQYILLKEYEEEIKRLDKMKMETEYSNYDLEQFRIYKNIDNELREILNDIYLSFSDEEQIKQDIRDNRKDYEYNVNKERKRLNNGISERLLKYKLGIINNKYLNTNLNDLIKNKINNLDKIKQKGK
jgi:hypothetical protein